MSIRSLAFLAVAATAIATPVLADGPPALENLHAYRADAEHVTVAFSYQGGACEEVGPAEHDAVEGDTIPLEFPVISLSEVCTMQIVEHEVEQTIEANEAIRRIEVILSAPDGTVMGSGATEIGK